MLCDIEEIAYNYIERVKITKYTKKETGLYRSIYKHITRYAQCIGNVLHGTVVDEYENGYPYIICRMKRGLLHGQYTSWHENRQLYETRIYKNGKLNGRYKCYFSNGKISKDCMYRNHKVVAEFKI